MEQPTRPRVPRKRARTPEERSASAAAAAAVAAATSAPSIAAAGLARAATKRSAEVAQASSVLDAEQRRTRVAKRHATFQSAKAAYEMLAASSGGNLNKYQMFMKYQQEFPEGLKCAFLGAPATCVSG
jgi:hypothetical protein